MVVHSIANNSYIPLASGDSFEGGIEVTTQGVSICVSTFCSSEVKVIIKQYRQNAASTLMHSNEENVAADTKGLVQTPVKAGFFSIKVENLGSTMTFTNITTVLQETHYLNLDIRSLTSARDSLSVTGVSNKTSAGDLIVNGSSSSATRPVYLMDVGTWYRVASVGNTPGHVWTSIGAIVGGESIPTVGRLFKCLLAPANIQGQGTVYDVEYSDTVTATPVGVQDISGSVSLLASADPTIELGKVRLTDSYGAGVSATAGNLMVGINNIYTANPLHTILDSGSVSLLASVDPTIELGKVRLTDSYGAGVSATAGNLMVGINNIYTANPLHTILDSGSVSVTGSVAVTNADITSIKTNTARFGLAIGSNYEESVINTFTNLSITGGYLYNLNVYSAGSSGTNFLKVYGVANATFADTPLLIVPIPHATSIDLSLSGLKALTGISVRATANYVVTDNNAPTNQISCNLTFSPLV